MINIKQILKNRLTKTAVVSGIRLQTVVRYECVNQVHVTALQISSVETNLKWATNVVMADIMSCDMTFMHQTCLA